MGTRGAFGVRINGQDKVTYNHFDSYPSGLGLDIAKQLTQMLGKMSWEDFVVQAEKLTLFDDETDVSTLDKHVFNHLRQVADNVDEASDTDMYNLLRKLQGRLDLILGKAGAMLDSHNFLKDSLFCEWAYIANLDTGKLEIYKGFNQHPGQGRYANDKYDSDSEYYGVSLVHELDLKSPYLDVQFLQWMNSAGHD